ncbi:UDP-N-acetylmuramoyl-tripeptide--D-alanyl-D-alanine ligase [Candidatus Microgenomates bacterium]|nr:UDP-N-acetylmuramoyl-tripeptide--D-alanyl-D-alanine ligase [Candidatus Microgenomates bacterium]
MQFPDWFFPLLVVAIYGWEIITTRQIKRPVLTAKSVVLVGLTLFMAFVFLNLPLFEIFFWVLILDKSLPLIVAIVVFLLSFPTEIWRDRIILQAEELLRQRKKLTVIGVTGSFGKSSTKEFVAQVLSEKFKVLKTPGSQNTPIGIAKTIIKGLRKDTQVLVVEIGAYKIGEIEEVCQIIKPSIGILTGISAQHLSLFGSIDNIIQAKYELIKSLPKNGLAVFNSNNLYCRELYQKTKINKLRYGFSQESDVKVKDWKVNPQDLRFTFQIGRTRQSVKINLLGRHNVENLLPAILVAHHLGMTLIQIKKALEKISYLPLTMQPIKFMNAMFIDDTFNASPEGVNAAFDYLKVFKKRRKILILTSLIELGKEADKVHENLGREAGNIFDIVYLTNNNFAQSFADGLKRGKKTTNFRIAGSKEIKEMLLGNIEKGDVVLFEGKEAGTVLKLL